MNLHYVLDEAIFLYYIFVTAKFYRVVFDQISQKVALLFFLCWRYYVTCFGSFQPVSCQTVEPSKRKLNPKEITAKGYHSVLLVEIDIGVAWVDQGCLPDYSPWAAYARFGHARHLTERAAAEIKRLIVQANGNTCLLILLTTDRIKVWKSVEAMCPRRIVYYNNFIIITL